MLWHYPGRKSVGYYGAVRLRDGKSFFRQEPERFDEATVFGFFWQFESASREAGRHVIVIIDNAQYHHAKLHAGWRAEQLERFGLDFLPPYSPELNPIERVWQRTRRNRLHNVCFPKLAMVVAAVEEQFEPGLEPTAELASLCRI